MKSFAQSLNPTSGKGIVIDIGTGDGRFVFSTARKHPNKFFIGVDANVKPLEKPSMKATRKPAKGGLPNAMFVQAAIEDLPKEFNGVANEIHIHFPWGTLLKGVALGEEQVLASLRRIASEDCLLEIVIGMDAERDRSELARLGIPFLTPVLLHSFLIPKFTSAGFELIEARELTPNEWARLETAWARRLRSGQGRAVNFLLFRAVAEDEETLI